MFPHTITVVNKYTLDSETKYHCTQIDGVFYYKSNNVSKEENGIKNTSKYNCIIPLSALNNYVDKKTFDNLEDKSNKFTLKNNDLIILGECDGISSASDLKDYEYFPIININDNRYGSGDLQNFEVTN